MSEFDLIKCVVCELKWPRPALDKWGVCPVCYKDGRGVPEIDSNRW
jgi:hypothetical protein